MKIIKSALFAALALAALTTASMAASLNGAYLEVGSSAIGVELDGKVTETRRTGDTTTGQVGKTAVTVQYGLGYMTPRSNKIGLDLGYMWLPGEAKIKSSSTDSTASGVTFEVSDSTEYYISPMINITEDASIYVKYAWNEADVKVTGDVTKISSMDGNTVALGTVMSWGSNLYIRTEAGMTDYNALKVTGLGTSVATTTTVTATPTIHYGKIAIGYKF